MSELTDAKRRIIERLKRVESATAAELADEFHLTDTAIRQHLDALASAGLVDAAAAVGVGGRGRPAQRWRLSTAASELFPDRHGDLSVELIESIRRTLGDEALDQVIADRASRQLTAYRAELTSSNDLHTKVNRLAELRTDEGYLAEATSLDDGTHVIVEHHCPVAGAAAACRGLCSAELDLFRQALGPGVTVERRTHLLSGDTRCTYQISPAAQVVGR